MEIVGRGRGSWLRAATCSREVVEEEVDEDDTSVAVPEKGTDLGWDAEEPDDEGPGILGPTSSVAFTAGLSSCAFPFGFAIVVVAVYGWDGSGEDEGTVRCVPVIRTRLAVPRRIIVVGRVVPQPARLSFGVHTGFIVCEPWCHLQECSYVDSLRNGGVGNVNY